MEWRPPLHLGVVAIEKAAFGSISTKAANFYGLYCAAKAAADKDKIKK